MKRIFFSLVSMMLLSLTATAQQPFLTVAESSDYTATSDYGDVMDFIAKLNKSSKYIRVENIAVSSEGRDVPLLVIGNPLPKSPESLVNDPRIVVYVQANIHAGEVEGKEASLMFARDLLSEKKPALLENVVLLICPNFNPDGNEKMSAQSRPHQNGPKEVGIRYNGQMLDLNRDGMKAESPEVRGLISNVFNRWDPDVFMDCHTTNGSYHIEPVTFTWMVNPNGDNSLIKYMETKMVPEMSATLYNEYKVENCFYGEFRNMINPDGWFYDAVDPRYLTNYYGLRNRLAVLNENYVYADYKSRVLGCYYLIETLVRYASANSSEIVTMLREVDNKTVKRGLNPSVADSFAVEYKVRPIDEKVTIKTYEVERSSQPNVYPPYRRTDRRKDVTVPYFVEYYPTRSVKLPYAYLITNNDPDITGLLKIQGIKLEKLAEETEVEAERFQISELTPSRRLNQGHYTNTVKGNYINGKVGFPAGTIVVRTAQPLANLAAYLLEAESNDGLVTWNFLDRYIVPQWGSGYNLYPVYRIMNPAELETVIF
ncbi:MAG TPA: M14 family metallopeptidase [Bacteroidales bacterium]|nr:M14 family metallopeptidase [Bacteroidales bacterium]HPF02945.1 M14 family metallopeptidase [Bacteroidales bacterium]HPJ58429.1 M14 family metallopeptidase [Bacteroidales bacterium]HRW85187.1 M14 family metallopeptidase [Bacteroidales bacterium]